MTVARRGGYNCVERVADGAEYIVTNNVKDFAGSKTPALTPEEFIAKLEQN